MLSLLKSSLPQAPIFIGRPNSLGVSWPSKSAWLPSMRVNGGGEGWKCIRMQNFAFAISTFSLLTPPSRIFPSTSFSRARGCVPVAVTHVRHEVYILRASLVSETFRRPLKWCTNNEFPAFCSWLVVYAKNHFMLYTPSFIHSCTMRWGRRSSPWPWPYKF